MKPMIRGLRRPHQRTYAAGILLSCLLTVLLLAPAGCGKKEEPPPREVVRPVKIMKIGVFGENAIRRFPARVRAHRRVDLSFKVPGPLVELPVEEGQEVKNGQLIARILPRDFKLALDKAKAKALEAEQQFQRYRALYAKNQVSKADFDRYQSERDVAVAQEQDAQNALKDTNLRAPFDGVVATRYVENFQEVQAKEPIVFFQDISRVDLLINVPESDMATVRGEQEAKSHAEFPTAPGQKFDLALKEFSTQADPNTQTYQVVLIMPQPDGVNILPGMTGTVVVELENRGIDGPQIVIPAIAVLGESDGGSFVWVLDEQSMTVKKAALKVGGMTGSENIVVEDGLKGGETIVIAGVRNLEDGMKVRIWEGQQK